MTFQFLRCFFHVQPQSECSLDSPKQDHVNWMLPDDQKASLSTDTVIEMDALIHGSLTDPVVVTTPNVPLKVSFMLRKHFLAFFVYN